MSLGRPVSRIVTQGVLTCPYSGFAGEVMLPNDTGPSGLTWVWNWRITTVYEELNDLSGKIIAAAITDLDGDLQP